MNDITTPAADNPQPMDTPVEKRAADLVRTHGDWTIRAIDDQPIPEGKTFAPNRRVVLSKPGKKPRELMYPGYRVYTLLAHWTDGLEDLELDDLEPEGWPDEDGMPEDPTELGAEIRAAIRQYRLPITVAAPGPLTLINGRIDREFHRRADTLENLLGRALPFVDYHG